ncbi:hypothetical protein NOVA_21960 [Nocardia nova]|uniref:hypothetical protein n=1 Tax=Nocardia nova TaxID=37330 RepID=UPI001C46AA68|nr:hypothetical protein [Nocardia nova]MBV7705449.1 hypothetical protein [Nocardia nova]
MAINSQDFDQKVYTYSGSDRDALESALRAAGIAEDDLTTLRAALHEDEQNHVTASPGSGVTKWLREISGKAAAASATAATTAVLAYYGLPSGS